MTSGLHTPGPPEGEGENAKENFAEAKAAQDALADVSNALEGLKEIAERVSTEGLKTETVEKEKTAEEHEGPAEIENTGIEPPKAEVVSEIQPSSAQAALPFSEAPVKKMKVGERLRAARLDSGFSLEEVAAEVKIKPHHLQALEEGKYGELPSRTYAVGFVRSYAHALGLPAEELAEACRHEAASHIPRVAPIHVPTAAMESPLPSASIVVLCALLAFGLYALSYFFFRPAVIEPPAPAPLASLPPMQLTPPVPTPQAAPQPPPQPPPPLAPQNQNAVQLQAPIQNNEVVLEQPRPQPVEQPEIDTTNVAPGLLQKGLAAPITPEEDSEAEVAPPAPSRIKLRAGGDATVQIFDAFGKMIAERMITRGEAFFVPDKAGYTMATSNAGAIHVQIDGKELAPLGDSDEAMHNIPLNAETLRKYLQ